MYKLVVLSLAVALVAGKPSGFLAPLAPLAYQSTLIGPVTKTISTQSSSVIHPSPVYYSAPAYYGHYLKKRSAVLAAPYFAPTAYAHAPLLPAATTYSWAHAPAIYSSPLVHSVPGYSHILKKRSAILPLSYTYPATTYAHSTPYLASAYTAPIYKAPVYTTPLLHSAPLHYF